MLTAIRTRWATCRCGHPVAWHRHHRAGRDCSGRACACRRPRRGGSPAPETVWSEALQHALTRVRVEFVERLQRELAVRDMVDDEADGA